MKQKILLLFTICFLLFTLLWSQTTFINSYPYQDLWPDHWYYTYHDGVTNVIPAIGGGFLMTAWVNPGYEFWEEPQTIFYKISEEGELEWRIQDYSTFGTYIRSIVSNGIDRYYAIAGSGGTYAFTGKLLILDEDCNVIDTHDYWLDDSLHIKINSMQILDDSLIMAGRIELDGPDSYVILKTDFEGNILWQKDDRDFNITVGYPWEFNSIITTSDNSLLTCGFQSSNPGTGYLIKFDAQGDTLWTIMEEQTKYSALLEYDDDTLFAFRHGILMKYSSDGNLITEYDILTFIDDQAFSTRMIKTIDDNIIIFFNAEEGEIHKVTPDGELLWSRDYLYNGQPSYPDWIGINDKKGFQLANGGYVFCGTTDRLFLHPEHVLIRVDEEGNVGAENYELQIANYELSNFPNPFNPSTKISLSLPMVNTENTEIQIFNIKGQKIASIPVTLSGVEGRKEVIWSGTDNYQNQVSSGVYLYRIVSDGFVSKTKKMMLIK